MASKQIQLSPKILERVQRVNKKLCKIPAIERWWRADLALTRGWEYTCHSIRREIIDKARQGTELSSVTNAVWEIKLGTRLAVIEELQNWNREYFNYKARKEVKDKILEKMRTRISGVMTFLKTEEEVHPMEEMV
jgi:hypothetical protein